MMLPMLCHSWSVMLDKLHLSQSVGDVAAAKNVNARPALFELLLVLHTSSSVPPFLLSVLPTGLAGSLNTSRVQKLRQPRSDSSGFNPRFSHFVQQGGEKEVTGSKVPVPGRTTFN